MKTFTSFRVHNAMRKFCVITTDTCMWCLLFCYIFHLLYTKPNKENHTNETDYFQRFSSPSDYQKSFSHEHGRIKLASNFQARFCSAFYFYLLLKNYMLSSTTHFLALFYYHMRNRIFFVHILWRFSMLGCDIMKILLSK